MDARRYDAPVPAKPAIRPNPPPEDAINALDEAINALGLAAKTTAAELILSVSGTKAIHLPYEWLAVPTRDAVERRLQARARNREASPILIANRIADPVRAVLREAGWSWLDRRGHLRIVAAGIFIDTEIPSSLPKERQEREVLGTEVGRAVAIQLLLHPTTAQTIRPIAAAIGRSSSAVGSAMQELRQQSLIRGNGLPLSPELFWELSSEWRPKVTALARRPKLDHPDLDYAIDQDALANGHPGWCLTNTVAAHAWGAPLTTTAETPPSFLIPSARELRLASTTFGNPERFDQRAASGIIAPVPAAVRLRYLHAPRSKRTTKQWPLAHPLFVALELARDKARGRDVLDDWTPPTPFHRVW